MCARFPFLSAVRLTAFVAVPLAAFVFLFAAPSGLIAAEPDPPFTAEFVPDPQGRWDLKFHTVKGWHYTIEETRNLIDWTPCPGGFFYGDGLPKAEFIIQGAAPPENGGIGSPANPGQGKAFRHITFQVRLSSTPSSPRILVRRQAEGLFAEWDAALDLALPRPPSGYRSCPLLDYDDATHMVWVDANVNTGGSLEETIAPAGDQEIFERQVFLGIVNQLTANLNSPAAPPTASPLPSTGKFLRVKKTGN